MEQNCVTATLCTAIMTRWRCRAPCHASCGSVQYDFSMIGDSAFSSFSADTLLYVGWQIAHAARSNYPPPQRSFSFPWPGIPARNYVISATRCVVAVVYNGLQLDAVRISSVDGDDLVVLVEVRDDDRADVAERLLVDRTVLLRTLLVHLHPPAPVAPPGFCNRGEVRYGSIGGLEYDVPQSRLYCLCINVALCSTALQCICRVNTKKFHDNESIHILHNFWTSTHRGEAPRPGGATAERHYVTLTLCTEKQPKLNQMLCCVIWCSCLRFACLKKFPDAFRQLYSLFSALRQTLR